MAMADPPSRPTAIRGPVLTFTGDPFAAGLETTWSTSPTPSSSWRMAGSRSSARPIDRPALPPGTDIVDYGRDAPDHGRLHRQPRPLPADPDDRFLWRAAARLAEQVHLSDRAANSPTRHSPRRSPSVFLRRTCATASPRAASIAPSTRTRSTPVRRGRAARACGSPPAR